MRPMSMRQFDNFRRFQLSNIRGAKVEQSIRFNLPSKINPSKLQLLSKQPNSKTARALSIKCLHRPISTPRTNVIKPTLANMRSSVPPKHY